MTAKKNANTVRLSKDDRIVFLEKQRELLQIKEQIQGLHERFAQVNQGLLECLNLIAKRERLDPNLYTFDLAALEFNRKKA